MTPRQRFSIAAAISVVFAATLAIASPVERYLKRDDAWFASDEARRVAANVLSWQSPQWGGWPKNLDTAATTHPADAHDLDALQDNHPTFDNDATTGELRFLARMIAAADDAADRKRYRTAFDRGFNYVLLGQYPGGGWPQVFPPDTGYDRYVTLNDDAMVRLMTLLDEAGQGGAFAFLTDAQKTNARAAFDRGLDCLLKCQVRSGGKLTGWCQQYDPATLEPRGARTFELPGLTAAETTGVVRLLMRVERPSPAVVAAVDGAVAWLDSAALHGVRVRTIRDERSPRGFDRRVEDDLSAGPLWARFYDLHTGKPFFADRDGVARATLAEIGYERRNGYNWLGAWPAILIAEEYPAWKARAARAGATTRPGS